MNEHLIYARDKSMNATTFSDTSDGANSTARTITTIPSQDVGDEVADVVNGGYDGTSSSAPIKKIEPHQQYRPIEDNASNSTTTPPITSPHASIHNNNNSHNNMNQHQHLIGSCVRSSTSSSSAMITDPSTSTPPPPQDEDDDESIVGSTLFQNKITSTLSVKPKIDNQNYSDTTPIDAAHMLVDSAASNTFNKSRTTPSSSMHDYGHVGNVNHDHVSSNMTSTPPPTSSTQHVNMTSNTNVHACNNVDQPTSSTLSKSKGGKSIKFQMENPSDPNYKSITQKSNYKDITLEDMSKYFHLPQTQAAEMLGVSLSTLKRRFYSFGIGRWPSYENNTSNVLANLSNLNSSMSPSTTQSMSITTNNNTNMTSSPHASAHSNVVNVVDTTGHASNPNTSNLHTNALHVLAAASTNVTKNVSDVFPPSQDASQLNPPPTSQIMQQTKVMSTTQPPQHSTLNTAIRMSHPPNVNTTPTNTNPNTRVFTHEHHYVRHSPSTPPNEHPQSSKMYEEHDESIVQHYQQKTHAPQEVHIHHHHYHIYQQNNHSSEYYPHYSDKFMPSRHYSHQPPSHPPPPSIHHHALEMGRPSSYSPPPPYHSRSQQQYIGYSNSPNSPQREGNNVHALNQTVVQGSKAQPVPVASHNQFKKSPLLDQLNPSETKEKTPSDSSETSYDDSNRRINKSYLYHPYQKQQTGGIHHYRPISPEQPPVVYSRHAPPSTLQPPPPYYPYSSSSGRGSDFKTSGYPIGEAKYYQGNNSTSYHHYEHPPVPTHNVYSSTSATPPNPYYGSHHPYSNSPNWEDNSLRKEGNIQNNMGENPRQYHNSR